MPRAGAPTTKARRSAGLRAKAPKRILNCAPSPDPHADWNVEAAEAAGIMAARARMPRAIDLRDDWWRIGDQGSTGSCVGWATADSLLRWHFVKAGRVEAGDRLSVRFIWMAAKETDPIQTRPTTFIEPEGTTLKAALDVARKFGCVRERDLPFATGRLYRHDSKAFYLLASRLKINAYVNLGRDPRDWRRWLATEGPILTRLDCDDAWMDARSTKGVLETYDESSAQGGHAVALVGYTPTGFVVRNSWGTSWGDRGFAHPTDDYASAAFTESYGISLL